jgi:hypothetical protein
MPSLRFLTATRSQVRIAIGAKSLVKAFLVDSTIATNHVVSVAQDGVDPLRERETSTFLQQLCVGLLSYDGHSRRSMYRIKV